MKAWRFGALLGLTLSVGLLWAVPVFAQATQDEMLKRGQDLFKTLPNKCPVCHKIGAKSAGGKLGPDLDGVANRHPESWFVPYLTNPKSINPKNVMPPVKVSDADMKALVTFLMSLKGGK